MIHKNAGAARDVPPPGLSEQTVLISLYFVLQRLLLPHMAGAAASGSGPLAAFPAHELFVASHSNDLHPLHDTPRVGGIMSHLLREVVVAREHRGAVQVKVGALGKTACSAAGSLYCCMHGAAGLCTCTRHLVGVR
jgi:hypothetical protein